MRTRADTIPRRIQRPGMFTSGNLPPGIYGSSLPGTLIRDAIAGTDSLDVVTIGDSNAGFSYSGFGGAGGGWTRGWLRALNALGAPTYSTNLNPVMVLSSVNTAVNILKEDNGSTITTIAGWGGNVLAPYGTSPNNVRVGSGAGGGPTDVTNSVVPNTNFMPLGLTSWNYAFLPLGSSVQTFQQPVGTYPLGGGTGASAPETLPAWCATGTAVRYRTIYATQNTSTSTSTRARFNPTAYTIDAGTTYTQLAQTAVDTYQAGSTVFKAADLSFTMPADVSGRKQAVLVGWNYIGMAYGPASVIWDCVYKPSKGIAVNNLHYGSGQSVSTISDIISQSNGVDRTFMVTYFQQLIARQQAATGTGRVLVWVNYGVNSPVSDATWTSKTEALITFMQAQWTAAGGLPNNLAFVVSVTHPLDTDYGGTTEATLAGNRAAANAWAPSVPNTTVVDLSKMYTAAQCTANGYYAGAGAVSPNGEMHLTQAGYYAFASKFMPMLAASV